MSFPLCLPGTSINPIIHVPCILVTIKLKSWLSMWWTLTCCLHHLLQLEPRRTCCILPHFSFSALVFLKWWILWAAVLTFVTFSLGLPPSHDRWLSASAMDVICSDIFFCMKYQKLRNCEVLVWTVMYKLKTPTWVLVWRSLSPSPTESQHTWQRWCCSVFCSLSLLAWMSSTALDLSTCWGRRSSKQLRKAATRATHIYSPLLLFSLPCVGLGSWRQSMKMDEACKFSSHDNTVESKENWFFWAFFFFHPYWR